MAEKEYIERGALLQRISLHANRTSLGEISEPYMTWKDVLVEIKCSPAADVEEVRHGEWIIKTDYKTPVSHAYIRKEKLYICPYCGKEYRQHMNFCGNCGAKMDGERKEATL